MPRGTGARASRPEDLHIREKAYQLVWLQRADGTWDLNGRPRGVRRSADVRATLARPRAPDCPPVPRTPSRSALAWQEPQRNFAAYALASEMTPAFTASAFWLAGA